VESQITICLTSCGRFDLLEKTITSVAKFWDGPPPIAFFINEDSGLPLPVEIGEFIAWKWPDCEYKEFAGYKNQIAAIDRMYKEVETPYIMHLECDWEFFKTGFVLKSLSILEEKAHIMQIWLRSPNDRNGHPAIGQVLTTEDGVKYQMMKTGYRGVWNGFSFNCGLRRLSDYQKLFPNGMYADVHWSPSNPLQAEQLVGKQYFKHGFRAATLLEGFCVHTGINRHING
jgi:hypothetical protein